MKVYGETEIAKFGKKHADSRKPLARFLEIAKGAERKHLADLKATFSSADYTPESGVVVFNIGGNKYRLTAAVDFEEKLLSIQAIMTHNDYTRENL